MSKTEYLYGIGVDSSSWRTMNYTDVLVLKIKLAHKRIEFLNTSHYMEKDSCNITECVRAMGFNRELLKELK